MNRSWNWNQTDSFKVADETGSDERVYVYTLFEESSSPDGRFQRTNVGKAFKLADGEYVDEMSDGSLVESGTGRKLRRV